MAKKLKTDIKPKKEKLRFSVPDNLAELSGPTIKLCSNREASVDGCRGVVDYYDNIIKLRISKGSVVFTGSGLSIVSFTDTSAIIRGRIDKVEYLVG